MFIAKSYLTEGIPDKAVSRQIFHEETVDFSGI
jgi:hypothetical protein